MNSAPETAADLEMARRAAAGDGAAQRAVNRLAAPLIEFQNDRFCKRFCRGNRYRLRCSLPRPLGGAPADAAGCEWGNAGYGWMLEQLCGATRLGRYAGRARLFDYLYTIANSAAFYERWKDWRFGRRHRVPAYIAELGSGAGAVYHGLCAGSSSAEIAQQAGLDEDRVERLAGDIVLCLTRRGRLYLLDPPREESLSRDAVEGAAHQRDVAVDDDSVERDESRERLLAAWAQLDPVEQFVLEAMIVDGQSAEQVLAALRATGVSIKAGVDAADTDPQQLYYFRRKALARLASILHEGGTNSGETG